MPTSRKQGPQDRLPALARAELRRREGDKSTLTKAEAAMFRAAAAGTAADCRTATDRDTDPAHAEKWGPQRAIRPWLVRWLCTCPQAAELVDPRGPIIRGARIDGDLDLSCVEIQFRLGFYRCAFRGRIDLTDARTRTLSFRGSHVASPQAQGGAVVSIQADGLAVRGDLHLNQVRTTGEVRLLGAKITGQLSCSGGRFRHPASKTDPNARALSADGIEVGGDAFFRDGFRATGKVSLLGARIAGQLACRGGRFRHPASRTDPNARALAADRIKVGGSAFLSDGFRATGEVRLSGAKITGSLTCSGGRFRNLAGTALRLQNASVAGNLFLDGLFRVIGVLDLRHAEAGVLADGADEETCPLPGELRLEGFTYGAIGPDSPKDYRLRRRWLARALPPLPTRVGLWAIGRTVVRASTRRAREAAPARRAGRWLVFFRALALDLRTGAAIWLRARRARRDRISKMPPSPQPYEQLAKVLRTAGHARDARKVLKEREDVRWRYGLLRWPISWLHWLFGLTVGYGFQLWRAVLVFVFFLVAGWICFESGKACGAMVPAKESIYMSAEYKRDGTIPPEYPKLSPLMYSLDTFVPLVDLHQEGYWLPASNCAKGCAVRFYLWFHIICGWVLTTMVLAGLTARFQARIRGQAD